MAEAGNTLINSSGPPCLPADLLKLRNHLQTRFASDSALRSRFLTGFTSYINDKNDLHRRNLSASQQNVSPKEEHPSANLDVNEAHPHSVNKANSNPTNESRTNSTNTTQTNPIPVPHQAPTPTPSVILQL
ncbi:hypothetical protein CTI12_AA283930 [Artemisia annua]|uniref:Uncharacterized protein n=1 Tax=Artemisia annua TaxID=35608 RepID=A0A2U1NC37_ARTAN|nr:hypothetical protein CTI12_AA283930 [Artemisia annua]